MSARAFTARFPRWEWVITNVVPSGLLRKFAAALLAAAEHAEKETK